MKPSSTIPALKQVKFDERHRLRDMTIPLTTRGEEKGKGYTVAHERIAEAYGNTGQAVPVSIFDPHDPQMLNWFINIYEQSKAGLTSHDDFAIQYEGQRFRAHVTSTSEGEFLELRLIPGEVPDVSELIAPHAWGILSQDNAYLQGGLILITGPQGSGKTTHASAICASRGLRWGGRILTIENPPEYPLFGWWGTARCFQKQPTMYPHPETGRLVADFAGSLTKTLREFPAMPTGGSMIFVGEIQDTETAAATILAAANKHCVVATLHGEDILASLERLCQLAGASRVIGGVDGAWAQLANNLKLVINQTINFPPAQVDATNYFGQGTYDGTMMWVPGPTSNLAQLIRSRAIPALREIINQQTAVARRTKPNESIGAVQAELSKIPNVT